MAEEEAPKPEPAAPPTIDEGWLESKIRAVVDAMLGEGDAEDKGKTEDPQKPAPKNDRETEDDFRGRVRAAVDELERTRSHDRQHEDLKKPPAPPQQETKPWRHRMWE